MCRTTDFPGSSRDRDRDTDRVKIKAVVVRFTGLTTRKPLPDSLTQLYPARINETSLDVNGSKIRPDSTAFVILHRVVSVKTRKGEAIYASREAVRAGSGVQFEIYMKEEKVLKGILRRENGWRLECKQCEMEGEGRLAEEAEVVVALEGDVAMRERVELAVRRSHRRTGFDLMEEIPEEGEVEKDTDGECCCTCDGLDSGDVQKGGCEYPEMDMDMEGVKWAVDVGLWAMCFGVGYLVSKASAKTMRRKRMFF